MTSFYKIEQFVQGLFGHPKESLDFLYSSNFARESLKNKKTIKQLRSSMRKVSRLSNKTNSNPVDVFYLSVNTLVDLYDAINNKGISPLTIFSPMQRFELVQNTTESEDYADDKLLESLYDEVCYPAICSLNSIAKENAYYNNKLLRNFDEIQKSLDYKKISEESIGYLKKFLKSTTPKDNFTNCNTLH